MDPGRDAPTAPPTEDGEADTRRMARAPTAGDEPTSPSASLRLALDREAAMERAELAETLRRTRDAFRVAFVMWAAFFAMDVLVVKHLHAGSLTDFALVRFAALALVVPVLVRLYREPPPSLRLLATLDVISYTVPAVALGIMATWFRGLESPYAPGVCIVLLARGVTVHHPWRRGAVMTGVPALAFLAVSLGAALVYPPVAAQLRDPAALTVFTLHVAYIVGTAVFTVVGGHLLWVLKRQVFEARDVGRYRLVRRLGVGGMGEVWVAHHTALKRDVAVKIIRSDVGNPETLARFQREVKATTELAHPNTVRIFDYGVTEDGLSYYVMELLQGETLSDLVRREGPLPPARALHLVHQAARALAEAHEHGIVHRDVKPENLFVTSLGGEPDFVKVLDFGIARLTRADAKMTQTGTFLGTPAYVSPEVILGGAADARSDVYSLGCVLYFLLSGHDPFERDTTSALLIAHVSEPATPPSQKLGRALPTDVEGVVMRALQKDPDARQASAAALAEELAACHDVAEGQKPARTPNARS